MVSQQGMTIRFSEDDVRAMGRATAGVRGMRLKNENDAVVSSDVARDDAVLLFVSSSGHGKRTRLAAFNRQGRGGQGVRGMRITEARGGVVAAFTVVEGDEILLFSSAGNLVRIGTDEISEQGRDATGYASLGSAMGIPLSPWRACSRPRTATAHLSMRLGLGPATNRSGRPRSWRAPRR